MVKLERKYTEPEYRALDMLSYSKLAGVDKDPANILSEGMKLTKSLIYGSAVDCLIFDGEEEFYKKFALLDYKGPSDKIVEVIDDVFEQYKSLKDSSFFFTGEIEDLSKSTLLDDNILNTARRLEYGASNWKDETIIKKIKEDGSNYFNFLKDNEDKIMLDAWMLERAKNSVHVLKHHPFTSKYFTPVEGVDIYFQFPVIWKYNGKECKSLFDILIIDHNNKIIKPVDLKTTYDDVLSFPYNYIKWKYYIQASFYSKSLSYLKLEYKELFDYKIDLFKFVVISSQDSKRPLVYKTTDVDILVGEHGGYLKDGTKIKGFKQLIEDMEWHIENEVYDFPKEVYDNKGELEFDIFKTE